MPIGFLLLLVAFPLLELVLLIAAGQRFGIWPVVGTVLATGVGGLLVIRLSGVSVLRRMMRSDNLDNPVPAMVDTSLLVGAGVLLMFPGLIGDAAGLLLLLPPVRRLLVPLLSSPNRARFRVWRRRTSRRGGDPGFGPGGGTNARSGGASTGAPQVIEGEFERLGERPVDPRKPPGNTAS